MRKPMLTSDQLIEHLKNRGVLFNIIPEEEAKTHLSQHNNYFKLSSYRKNYTKADSGENVGKYINLEFSYLVELARLDTEVRHLLLQMALDIEHFLKVSLIKAVEDRMDKYHDEDGYKIVQGYLSADELPPGSSQSKTSHKRTESYNKKLTQNTHNPYCGGLINSYATDMPVWAFVELISFGDLIELVTYYSQKTGWVPPVDLKSLDRVRQIRNACAHGNAIINDLRSIPVANSGKQGISITPYFITAFLQKANISKDARSKKLSNPRINQIVHLLYIYDTLVTSYHTRHKRISEVNELLNRRMTEHGDYFQKNSLLISTHAFFVKIVSSIRC